MNAANMAVLSGFGAKKCLGPLGVKFLDYVLIKNVPKLPFLV